MRYLQPAYITRVLGYSLVWYILTAVAAWMLSINLDGKTIALVILSDFFSDTIWAVAGPKQGQA